MKSNQFVILNLLLVFVLLIGGSFYSSTKTNQICDVEFFSATSKGLINVSSKSAGGFSGKCIFMKIKNKSANKLNVKLPQGTLFYPKDNGEQTLITIEDQFLTLNPMQEIETQISGFCSEFHDHSPTKNELFTISYNKQPKFDSLFKCMNQLKIPSSNFQEIVWAVTDNCPVYNVSNETEDLKKLRKYLFKQTKQKEVDYSTENIFRLDANGRIINQLNNVKGNLEFTVNHGTTITQEVYTKEGLLKDKLPIGFSVLEGKTKFQFNICVKNWKKGDYVLKLKSGNEEVAKYEFAI